MADYLLNYVRTNPVICLLMLANIIVFILTARDSGSIQKFGTSYESTFANKEYYRMFTHIFMHSGFAHLAHNLLGIFLVGELATKVYGNTGMCLIYFASGILSSIFPDMIHNYFGNPEILSVGASGAVMGLTGSLFAFAALYSHELLFDIGLLLAINVIPTRRGVGYLAHFSGAVTGLVCGLITLPFLH